MVYNNNYTLAKAVMKSLTVGETLLGLAFKNNTSKYEYIYYDNL